MIKNIPSIQIPIINHNKIDIKNLSDFLVNKRVILFGVPGAFTPTCSEKHFPGFIKHFDNIIDKGIDEIICMSVNDQFVMMSWLSSYEYGYKIIGIADGNAELTKFFNLQTDKSSNFMGLRCARFSMIIDNNIIIKTFVEEASVLDKTSAENILTEL